LIYLIDFGRCKREKPKEVAWDLMTPKRDGEKFKWNCRRTYFLTLEDLPGMEPNPLNNNPSPQKMFVPKWSLLPVRVDRKKHFGIHVSNKEFKSIDR